MFMVFCIIFFSYIIILNCFIGCFFFLNININNIVIFHILYVRLITFDYILYDIILNCYINCTDPKLLNGCVF